MEEGPYHDLLTHLPPRLAPPALGSALPPRLGASRSAALLLATQNADGSVPFFWGTAADGCLVLSDDPHVLKEGCGKSFAPFPRGCFFSTSGGLQSYEHPLNKLMPMPRVDSKGQMCGANFKVDVFAKGQMCGANFKVDVFA